LLCGTPFVIAASPDTIYIIPQSPFGQTFEHWLLRPAEAIEEPR
jgi:hypothetical protein